MFPAVGLQTYIWNNRLKSVLLLAGFPLLLLLVTFAFAVLISAMDNPSVGDGIVSAIALLPSLVPVAVGGALIWFAIAWFANQAIVDAITGARAVSRQDNPRVYNLLENLAISRGFPTPTLRIIDTDMRNAFASGVRRGRYSVTVTRGLLDALDDRELAAVLGHELTHIRNGDVQLLIVSAVFVGIVSLAADLLLRSPRFVFFGGGSSHDRRQRSSGEGRGGGAFILIAIALAIFVFSRLLASALRFALSRKREFLADAGAVELTKDPDAMILALRKIEGRAEIKAPSQIREMFLENPHGRGLAGLFFTHPTIDARVDALVRYAGGRDPGPLGDPPPEPSTPGSTHIAAVDGEPGPWQSEGAWQSPSSPTGSPSPTGTPALVAAEEPPQAGPWSEPSAPGSEGSGGSGSPPGPSSSSD